MAIEQQPKLGVLKNETFRSLRSTLARHQIVSPGLIQCGWLEDVGGQAVGGRCYECTILYVCIDIIISHILHIYITIIYHLCVIYQYSVHIIDIYIYMYRCTNFDGCVCWYNMQSMHINQYSHNSIGHWMATKTIMNPAFHYISLMALLCTQVIHVFLQLSKDRKIDGRYSWPF